jgi:hypothetical protein
LVILATEDHGDLVRLADCAIGIQQSLAELIDCGPPVKDQVVAILHLREEELMLTACLPPFVFFEEWVKYANHFCPQPAVMGCQGICQLLELLGMTAFEKAFERCSKSMPSERIELASRGAD